MSLSVSLSVSQLYLSPIVIVVYLQSFANNYILYWVQASNIYSISTYIIVWLYKCTLSFCFKFFITRILQNTHTHTFILSCIYNLHAACLNFERRLLLDFNVILTVLYLYIFNFHVLSNSNNPLISSEIQLWPPSITYSLTINEWSKIACLLALILQTLYFIMCYSALHCALELCYIAFSVWNFYRALKFTKLLQYAKWRR